MFEKCLYYNLSALNRKIGKVWQTEFALIGLSPSHGYLLFAVVEDSSLSQKELASLLALDQSTMTRFVGHLVNKGFVQKDGKGKGAKLKATAEGTKKYEEVNQTMNKLYRAMQKKIGTKQFSYFVSELQKVRGTFEGEENE